MTMPTFYISHGGGPWPWMSGAFYEAHLGLANWLKQLPASLPEKPAAVLLVTAHWEGASVMLSGQARPGMLYDYGGFPANTYQVNYPAPGAPELAIEVASLFKAHEIQVAIDTQRGYDHGTFVPLSMAWPNADIPVLQMSLQHRLDAREHIHIGQALRSVRDRGVLIIGSGSSIHSMSITPAQAASFDAWLTDTLTNHVGQTRDDLLTHWQQAPYARAAHPRAEHLLPLMVATGAASDEPGQQLFTEPLFMGTGPMSCYGFGKTK